MGLYDWLKENGIYEVKRVPQKPEKKEGRIVEREPTRDELALGLEWSEDNEGGKFTLKGVPQSERLTHFYVVGASGTGKTKFLENLVLQDIHNGYGFGIIDPHGDFVNRAKELLAFTPKGMESMAKHVVLIDPTDEKYTISFNPLELTEGYSAARQASQLTEVFHRIWGESWGARMADILKNTLIALIENNLTLVELLPFLTDANFRAKLLPNVKNEACRDYFKYEFNELNAKTRSEWLTSTSNKVRTFLHDEDVKDIFLSTKSSINFRDIIDTGKILLVRLPKGLLGDENTALLGSLVLSHIQMAAFSRADMDFDDRVPYYLYIDEFQNFAAKNFAVILDEARKYKLALTLAHQNLSQVPTEIRSSVLNCPLQAYFRVLRTDAEILAKEMFVGLTNVPEPWETYFQKLQLQQTSEFYFKDKYGHGVFNLHSYPAEALGFLGEEWDECRKIYHVYKSAGMKGPPEAGEHYLREREAVRKEYRARKEALAGDSNSEVFWEEK